MHNQGQAHSRSNITKPSDFYCLLAHLVLVLAPFFPILILRDCTTCHGCPHLIMPPLSAPLPAPRTRLVSHVLHPLLHTPGSMSLMGIQFCILLPDAISLLMWLLSSHQLTVMSHQKVYVDLDPLHLPSVVVQVLQYLEALHLLE